MPRRPPALLRACLPVRERPGRTIRQVSRVSTSTLRAIADLERARLRPGEIAEALDGWARLARGPARKLDNPASEACPCCPGNDQVEHRDVLRMALHALPTNAARELRALVQPLDEIFLSRSVPEPGTAYLHDLLTIRC